MIKRYKKIILATFFLTSIAYGGNNKLKAEIKQKENTLIIKISKDEEFISENDLNKTEEIIYSIKQGDTLSQIALEYKKSIKKIAKDNNIKNIELITAGKILIIK
ncbi:LysM peptidoglycan-binding domain-containing protein [Cetobacterium sp.]|uniref:LysM peptidoglycan-binding domain-containing protein n=1 Tax=Cetobacterium sp. TaxID=2071632 RepID=UPI003F3F510D